MFSKFWVGAVLAAMSAPGLVRGMELESGTLNAWANYIQAARLHMQRRTGGAESFLWIDESPNRADRVRRGEVVVEPAEGRGTLGVPNGMIHHWIGAVFVPGGTIDGVKSVIQNYDGYQKIYKPAVVESKALACTTREREFSMIWHRHVLFVNSAIQGQFWSHDVMLDDHRGYDVSGTKQVQEIGNYAHRGERVLAPIPATGSSGDCTALPGTKSAMEAFIWSWRRSLSRATFRLPYVGWWLPP